jgi:alpha-methylacyl-CoA racemase
MWTRTSAGTNLLDTGAHFYDVYETADGEYVSIGSIEPQFYAELLRLTGLDGDESSPSRWTGRVAALKERLAEVFATKTRDEWCEIMEAHRRVLRAGAHDERGRRAPPQRRARARSSSVAGTVQPAPAPRFSRTPADRAALPPTPASTPRGAPRLGRRRRRDRRPGPSPARSVKQA